MSLIERFDVVVRGEEVGETADGVVIHRTTLIRYAKEPTDNYHVFVRLDHLLRVDETGEGNEKEIMFANLHDEDGMVLRMEDGRVVNLGTLPEQQIHAIGRLPRWEFVGPVNFPPVGLAPGKGKLHLQGVLAAAADQDVTKMPDNRYRCTKAADRVGGDRTYVKIFDPSLGVNVNYRTYDAETKQLLRNTRYSFERQNGVVVPVSVFHSDEEMVSIDLSPKPGSSRTQWQLRWLQVGDPLDHKPCSREDIGNSELLRELCDFEGSDDDRRGVKRGLPLERTRDF